jgi:hypothetical protein
MSDYRPYVICTLFPATSKAYFSPFVMKTTKELGQAVVQATWCPPPPVADPGMIYLLFDRIIAEFPTKRHNDRCKWQLEIFYVWYYVTELHDDFYVCQIYLHMPANPEAVFKDKRGVKKRLGSPGIDSKESIPGLLKW